MRLRANELAIEFRDLYRRSQEAYSEEDRASAKSLSIQGHSVQDQCENLNTKAKALQNQLKEIYNQIENVHQEAEKLKTKARNCKEKAAELRKTSVKNFNTSRVISDEIVEEILDEFPQRIFIEVKKIEYVEELFWESSTGKIKMDSRGQTSWNKDGKAVTKVGRQSATNTHKLKETVAHEIGHVVYEFFVTDEQKAEWYVWHMEDLEREKFITLEAISNEVEDFAECFRLFKTDPGKLKNHDERRHNLINEIIDKLEHEET